MRYASTQGQWPPEQAVLFVQLYGAETHVRDFVATLEGANLQYKRLSEPGGSDWWSVSIPAGANREAMRAKLSQMLQEVGRVVDTITGLE